MYDIITVIKKNMMKMFTVKYTFGTIITIIIYNSPHILFAAYIKYCWLHFSDNVFISSQDLLVWSFYTHDIALRILLDIHFGQAKNPVQVPVLTYPSIPCVSCLQQSS